MGRTGLAALFLLSLFMSALSSNAMAGEFRVTPIRLEFEKGVKSRVISVSNEGEEGLNMQVTAMEWTQDEAGKDVYTNTTDIIFYPKIMTLEKTEKRTIRVGIKTPLPLREKTYRLFIEEIPEPKKKEPGAAVSVSVRFGVPLFIKPAKEETKGEIAKVEIAKGAITVLVKNIGNSHFMINSVNVTGKNSAGLDVFVKELAGWYLLTGASRVYSTEIPAETCAAIERVEVEVKALKLSLKSALDIKKEMCIR